MFDLKTPRTAREVDEIFVQSMNEGNLDQAMHLYHPNAVFVRAPGEEPLTGLDNIRENMKNFMDMNPRLKVELKQFVEAGDVAFFTVKWDLNGTTPDGEEMSLSAYDGNVVKRQEDGSWKIMIDNPFHSEHIGVTEKQ